MEAAPRLSSETFICAHLGRYLVHVPLLQVSLLVNRAMAELLQRLRRGEGGPWNAAERFALRELVAQGLVNGDSPPPPRSGIQEWPTEVALFLTERCNLRCVYCYAQGGEGRRSLSRETARAALEHILRHARETEERRIAVHFHGGGEVSLVWGILTWIVAEARRLAADSGLACRFSAGLNGVMSASRAREVPRWLDEATLSIDGLPEVQNRQRPSRGGRPTAPILERTLGLLDQAGFPYGLRLTLLPDSLPLLSDGIEYLCRLSAARVIQVEPASPQGRYEDGAAIDPEAFIQAFREAKAVARGHGRELKYSGARFPEVTDIFCRAVSGAFAVTPGGMVSSCFEAREDDERFVYGRFDPQLGDFRIDTARRQALLKLGVHHRAECQDCIAKYHCAGDCAMKSGTGPAAEARCLINRELTKDLILESLESSP